MPQSYDAIVIGARCAGAADGHAARPEGLPGGDGRSGDVSE